MKIFYIAFVAIATSLPVVAQEGIHKGDIYKSDSLLIEVVYPVKKSSIFQFYFYDSENKPIETVKKGNVNFFFSKDNSDYIAANLVQKEGIWLVSLEDWKEFHHAKLQYEINGIKRQLEFWNKKRQGSSPSKQSSGDGHSGHSH